MNILLIGSQGQLGRRLGQTLPAIGQVIALDRTDLDLCNTEQIRTAVRHFQPNVIINAAAYTDVDRAEVEPALAYAINGTAAGVLAQEAARLSALLIHYSTSYVFDGHSKRPYREIDECAPLNVYGRSKRVGELEIMASECAYMIFRTSWVYDVCGRNFLTTIQQLATEKPSISVVDDQIGTPTWTGAIVRATRTALMHLFMGAPHSVESMREASGIFHLTASGQTSWYGFAEMLCREMGLAVRLRPLSASEYPTAAQRPAYSVLDHTNLCKKFGIQQVDWRHDLRACLTQANVVLHATV